MRNTPPTKEKSTPYPVPTLWVLDDLVHLQRVPHLAAGGGGGHLDAGVHQVDAALQEAKDDGGHPATPLLLLPPTQTQSPGTVRESLRTILLERQLLIPPHKERDLNMK